MKILTGVLRGQAIGFSKNPFLRPTADKVRKALMDTLKGAIEGKKVLDLFSGTGALGMEALSNGASFVTFVEKHKIQSEFIRKSIEKMGLAEQSEIISDDAILVLEHKARAGESYDMIIADPPYGEGWMLKTFQAIVNLRILNPGAIVVLECAAKEETLKSSGQVRFIKEKIYGDSKLIFYGV